MKTTILLLSVFLVTKSALQAQNGPLPTAMSTTICYTSQDIVVDGYGDENLWSKIEILDFPYSFQDDFPPEQNFSATIQIAWKKELGIYVFLSVTDDMQHFLEDSGISHQRDCAEFFFYWGDEGDWGPETEVTAVENDSLFSQLRLQLTDNYMTAHDGRYKGKWTGAEMGSASDGKLEAVGIATSKGWDIEAIFPFAMFAIKPDIVYELAFGFDIIVTDSDEGDSEFKLSLMNDSKQDLAWNNKAYLNTSVLAWCYWDPIEPVSIDAPQHRNNISFSIHGNYLVVEKQIPDLQVYNSLGQIVMQKQNLTVGEHHLNLKPGVYFIQADENSVEKIIIP